jgi:hypothetical protein
MTRLLTIAVLMALGYAAGCSTARAAGMRFAWNANNPAEMVTSYELVLEEVWGFGIHAVETSETTAAIDGLKNGTAYFAKVRARNSIGWGEFSAAITGSTPAPMIRLTIQRSDGLVIWTDIDHPDILVEKKDTEFFRIKIEPANP